MAISPASAAATGSGVTTVVTETIAGSHVLMTVYGYSKLKDAGNDDDGLTWSKSERFRVGGYYWCIDVCEDDYGHDCLCLNLDHSGSDDDDDDDDDDEVKARFEVTLLNRAAETISSTQGFHTFPIPDGYCVKIGELDASALVGDSFQVICNIAVVKDKEITAVVRPPELHRHLGGLLANQVGADVTFDVGGELFAAHRCVLAARSAVFMAELFGPGKEDKKNTSTTATNGVLRINGVEPRVFRALLHFVYTDTLPDVNQGDDGDKVAMAQRLLVAADRYGVERLKLICADVLCNCIDARTAVALLELADKHGCHRLKEACIKVLLAKVVAP